MPACCRDESVEYTVYFDNYRALIVYIARCACVKLRSMTILVMMDGYHSRMPFRKKFVNLGDQMP